MKVINISTVYSQYSSWLHSRMELHLSTYKNQSQMDITDFHENNEWGILEFPAWKTTA